MQTLTSQKQEMPAFVYHVKILAPHDVIHSIKSNYFIEDVEKSQYWGQPYWSSTDLFGFPFNIIDYTPLMCGYFQHTLVPSFDDSSRILEMITFPSSSDLVDYAEWEVIAKRLPEGASLKVYAIDTNQLENCDFGGAFERIFICGFPDTVLPVSHQEITIRSAVGSLFWKFYKQLPPPTLPDKDV